MPKEVISFMLSKQTEFRNLQMKLILQCAPFFKEVKIASIVNVEEGQCESLDKMLENTGVMYRVLKSGKGKCLVILYRQDSFTDYLDKEEIREFLKLYGYECDTLEAMLNRLSLRIREHSDGEMSFPHEIGAFLDYPIDDVRSFIEKDGKDSLFSGYWKVYNHPVKAKKTFRMYDRAVVNAVNEFLSGKNIREIINCAA